MYEVPHLMCIHSTVNHACKIFILRGEKKERKQCLFHSNRITTHNMAGEQHVQNWRHVCVCVVCVSKERKYSEYLCRVVLLGMVGLLFWQRSDPVVTKKGKEELLEMEFGVPQKLCLGYLDKIKALMVEVDPTE